MRTVNAQMKIVPWSPNLGAKGELQVAWFRVKDILADQRSIRTCAKVGGLVGKVMEIDERTRLRSEYVRMKIACRDILKVPRVAEGNLGIYIHDFIFEREVVEDDPSRVSASGTKVGDNDPPPKKARTKNLEKPLLITGEASKDVGGHNGGNNIKSSNRSGQSLHQALPNVEGDNLSQNKVIILEKGKDKEVEGKPRKESIEDVDSHEKVHILDDFHESDVESESLSDKLRKIDAYYDGAQCSQTSKEME